MITLKTLSDSTDQEVFDQVATHLLTQHQVSLANDRQCSYRGDNGLKCAAGCLIGDDEYNASFMEGHSWLRLRMEGIVPDEHWELVTELQKVHDLEEIENWQRELRFVAAQFHLNCNVLENFY